MRLIYIHQYFKTPEEGGATRSFHLAKGLVEAGHEVEVISGGSSRYDVKRMHGFTVHYLPVSYSQEYSFPRRILAFVHFVRLAKGLIKKLNRPDLLYISSTPLTTGWIGLWAKKKFALPYIFEVRDIWPEAPIQVGAIRNPLLIKYLKNEEKRIYQNALSLVGLSPGIVNHIRELCPEKKTHLIPNFSNPHYFYPKDKSKKVIEEFGLKHSMTIAYTGAIGKVNAVEEMLDFASWAKIKGKDWQFLIMGKGSELEACKRKANELNLDSVRFFPFAEKTKVNEILSLADLAWISFAALPILSTNSPNKFFDAIAAGKGIIINHKGWIQRLVEQNELGFAEADRDWDRLGEELNQLVLTPEKLQKMSSRSRRLFEQFFTHEIAVRRLLHVLEPEKHSIAQDHEAYIRIA